ncbi:MAG: acyltransferase domain-containing protein, partial [bacterium]|nr:acyltransferase domain-containing protein [bacterium]
MTKTGINPQEDSTGIGIAVIGMAGRFPGARNIYEYWNNLVKGKESILFSTETELMESGTAPELLNDPNYVNVKGGVLEDKECFDASFFDFTLPEAEVMNSQMRVFFECVWEALEDAGYNPHSYDKMIGLYAGASSSAYWEAMAKLSGKSALVGGFASSQLANKDFLCSQISFRLNLKGPVVAIQTACSTSLTAVHLACQSLLDGECDIALAGGVSVTSVNNVGYLFQEGMIQSPDGHCRAFDARSKGTVSGEGAGIAVLKPLDEALDDGDHIYAVIKGTAINNDGFRKAAYTAPSIDGQVEAIRIAHQVAEIEPESISYIEAHGTGTTLGDPIEIEALTQAFDSDKKQFCRIGSVKTNIGHLDAAAGIAGLIKTVLSLKHKLIPPSLHYEKPNPKINFEDTPFYVNAELSEWKNDEYPLRAGVSSFGIGGTNAHAVIEEAPEISPSENRDGREHKMLFISAKTAPSLDRAAENLAEYFRNNPAAHIADVAYTLQVGRRPFQHRRFFLCSTVNQAVESLSSPGENVYEALSTLNDRNVIFMFPGQGTQYAGMGLDLYEKEPFFRKEMDRCFEILHSVTGSDFKEYLYPTLNTPASTEKINQTEITQPLLFIFEYALAKLLMKWGIKPYAMIGHSIGEYVAACLAGVFQLHDALALVAFRGKLMQEIPPGAMLSVSLSEKKLEPLLKTQKEVELAASNSPSLSVLSGTHQAIEAFEKQLNEKGIQNRRLHTSHAFHSKMMEPVLKKFEAKIAKYRLSKPEIPFVSNLTGKWIAYEEAMVPHYWTAHLRKTVRFSDGLKQLMEPENAIFVEVGPGKSLSTFLRQHRAPDNNRTAVNLVRHPKESLADDYYLLNKVGQLWLNGVVADWTEFYEDEERRRVPLPTYPFARQRFHMGKMPETLGMDDLAGKASPRGKLEIKDWFYAPSWKRSPLPFFKNNQLPPESNWLIFFDQLGIGNRLAQELQKKKQSVVTVTFGKEFKKDDDLAFTINPYLSSDYKALFDELRASGKMPENIVHLGGITGSNTELPPDERFEAAQTMGLYSHLYLAGAIGTQIPAHDIRITIVTDNMQEVTGDEHLCPEKATVLAAVTVLPQEYHYLDCRSIDMAISPSTGPREREFTEQILMELSKDTSEKIVAYRGNYRWVQTFEPVNTEPVEKTPPLLKKEGVYLITGGLGGVALKLAG